MHVYRGYVPSHAALQGIQAAAPATGRLSKRCSGGACGSTLLYEYLSCWGVFPVGAAKYLACYEDEVEMRAQLLQGFRGPSAQLSGCLYKQSRLMSSR